MLSRIALALSLFPAFYACPAQTSPVGLFDDHRDIGHVYHAGSTDYDQKAQTYQLKGSGANIWFNADQFHYTWKTISGDFILTADFAFVGDTAGAIGHRKTGWMLRESATDDAAGINACVHIDGLVALQWRDLRGAYMRDPEGEIFNAKKGCQTIQLERTGKNHNNAHRQSRRAVAGSGQAPDAGSERYPAGRAFYVCP